MESVSFQNFGAWVAAALVFLVAVDLVWRMVDRVKGKWEPAHNPPLHKAYTPIDDHRALAAKVSKLEETIAAGFEKVFRDRLQCQKECQTMVDDRFERSVKADTANREKLYLSIRSLEQSVAKLVATNEHHSATLANIDRRLTVLGDRTRTGGAS